MPSDIFHASTDPTFQQRLSKMLDSSARADIAVGYFFMSGFGAIADPLSTVGKIRLLVGRADQQVVEQVAAALGEAAALRQRGPVDPNIRRSDKVDLAAGQVRNISGQVASLRQTDDSESHVRQLRDMLASGQLEIRTYLRSPMHAKAYICWYESHAEPGAAMVGSSNFTLAGFHGNTELNVRITGDPEMHDLEVWFDALWADSVDLAPHLIVELDKSWAIAATKPYLVYLKALYELHKDELGVAVELPLDPLDGITLANFQTDAVQRALTMVDRFGGCYIGDVVGLGKTFIGAELLRQMRQVYPEDGPPLIICPAGLVDMWEQVNEEFRLGAQVVSHSMIAPPSTEEFDDDLDGDTEAEDSQTKAPSRGVVLADVYPHRGPVLVDEAHNFRNRNKRYVGLRHYLDTSRHRVVLLSATPQNISTDDVLHQLRLFLDNVNHGLDIHPVALDAYFSAAKSWREYARDFQAYLDERNKGGTAGISGSGSIPPDEPDLPRASVEEALAHVFIRRRRRDITEMYRDARINDEKITFPEPVLENLNYEFDKVYGASGDFETIQESLKSFRGARYQPLRYLKNDAQDNPEYVDLRRSRNRIAALMKALLYKRFESSVAAFRSTLERLSLNNRNFKAVLERGQVPVGDRAASLLADRHTDADSLIDALSQEALARAGSRSIKLLPAADFETAKWIADLDYDHQLLQRVLKIANRVTPDVDVKLQRLVGFLREPGMLDGKLLIFSESEATVSYLYENLRTALAEQPGIREESIARLTGSNRDQRASIIRRFAPIANPDRRGGMPEKEIQILIATDVVSEGQNLQDCQRVINYDLHWNPVRLIQRFGRIDRIGSRHDKIYIHNTWPATDLDRQLDLTDRLHYRVQAFHDIIGLDSKLLSESEQVNLRAMYSIYEEQVLPEGDDDLDDIAANQRAVALLQRIQERDPELWETIVNLPDGIRSAMTTRAAASSSSESEASSSASEGMIPEEMAPYRRASVGEPRKNETAVLVGAGSSRRCYAVGDDLQPRRVTAPELLRAIKCPPDEPRESLPANTNQRVSAAVDALRTEMSTVDRSRGGRGSRNRRFVAETISRAQSDPTISNLSPQRLEMLREIFTGDLPPDVDERLSEIRRSNSDDSRTVRRLENLRIARRLNPPDEAAKSDDERDVVVAALCSQGLV